MKTNIVLLLCGCVFLFPATAQNVVSAETNPDTVAQGDSGATALPGAPETPLDHVARPVRSYPDDTWIKRVLDSQVSDQEFINFLNEVLTHPNTVESVWEDALNALIYIKRKRRNPAVSAQVDTRIYTVFAEVIDDTDRTEGQRYDIMEITTGFGSAEAVNVLKNFVLSFPALPDNVDLDEEMDLRYNAIGFLEDIKSPSSLQALYDIVLFDGEPPLVSGELPLDLKMKALESLEDREAYDKIREVVVNIDVDPAVRSSGFYTLEKAGELSQVKEVALAALPEQDENHFGWKAIEVLGEHRAVRSLNEIASNSFVHDSIQEGALLQILALRKERQDRRLDAN